MTTRAGGTQSKPPRRSRFTRRPAEGASEGQARRSYPGALVVTAITAFIALLSGGLGLMFDAFPSLRPDPRTELGSTASVVALDRYVTVRDYLARRYPDPDDYRRMLRREISRAHGSAGLAIHGELAYVRVTIHGFKRRRVLVAWSLYDARKQSRVNAARTEARWTGEAPTDQFIDELWVQPAFDAQRRYFLRVEIRSADGVLLALADSRPFAGLSHP
jgi:hypothetical protein